MGKGRFTSEQDSVGVREHRTKLGHKSRVRESVALLDPLFLVLIANVLHVHEGFVVAVSWATNRRSVPQGCALIELKENQLIKKSTIITLI